MNALKVAATGDDNRRDRWSTSRWLGIDTTTVAPPSR
jgi:hypothetical protein